ncbi:hypothetical protein FOA52_015761 [Chlamydomonas sp. UWO 241]|nr:hypothetical protein FOA52_015761 [Chlamydomonas sp. UWO 241]
MLKCKKIVYKNRTRLKDFIMDFDKLRSGFVHENHFLTALSMAKLDKEMSPSELAAIAEHYLVERGPSLSMVDYASFLREVDVIFGTQNLDKTPLADAPMEPWDLVDPTRYQFSSKVLSDEDEEMCAAALDRLKSIISRRGTPVKPFFDDAASDNNSSKLYGHVTLSQFRQCLSTKLDLEVTETEAKVFHKKFGHEDKPEFLNYVAFSNTIDPILPVTAYK